MNQPLNSLSFNSLVKHLLSLILILHLSPFAFSLSPLCSDTVRITDFGLKPDSRINAVPYVQKALKVCAEIPGSVLVFPAGRYDFWPHQSIEKVYYESNTTDNNPKRCAILIEGLTQGVTIEGSGSDFVFHDRMQPVTVDNSRNVRINHINIDWEIPLTAEAEVVETDPAFLLIRINPVGNPYMIENGKIVFVGEGWKSEWWGTMEFTRETRTVAYKTGDWGCLGANWRAYRAEELSPGLIKLHHAFKRLPAKGNYLVLRHSERDHAGIFIVDSDSVYAEEVNLYHNAGLGVLAQFSSNLYFKSVNSVPNPKKNRILAGHDDGFHFSNCRGQISVEQCTFHGLMDDPINVHGTCVRIIERKSDKTLLCRFMHEQSVGMTWGRPGEQVGFIENSSMVTFGQGIVESWRALDLANFEVTFREPLPANLVPGDALENLSWTPDLTISGCNFKSNRARGILISTPGRVVVENNRFESSGSAILIAGDANYWYESGGVKDVTIRNNEFTDECLTSMYQFCEAVISIYPEIPEPDATKPCFHRNIRIENNHFSLYDYPVLYALSVDNLTFTGNQLSRSRRYEPWHPRNSGISLVACRNVIIKDNQIDPEVLGKNIRIEKMKKTDIRMGKGQFVY